MKKALFIFSVLTLGMNCLFAQGIWKSYTVEDGLLPYHVFDITQDHQGNYWVATTGGVCWMDSNEVWHTLVDSTCFDSTMIFENRILIDYENNKWFIGLSWLRPTREYVVRFDGSVFTYFDIRWPGVEDAREKHYISLGLDADGRVWAGSHDNWAFYFDGTNWHQFYVPGTSMYDPIFDFQLDKAGRFYIAHEHGIGTSDGAIILGGPDVYDLALDKYNNLWCATGGIGLGKFDGQNWQFYTMANGLLSDDLSSMAVDSTGFIYAVYYGNSALFSKFDGAYWKHIPPEGLDAGDYLVRPYVDDNGWIWFLSDQKIIVFQDTTKTNIALHSSLFEPKAHSILHPAFPNPFNSLTTISYLLTELQMVRLSIINIRGEEVMQFINDKQPAGNYEIVWNGWDNQGKEVSSGIYFCVLEAENFVQTQKITLIR